MIEAEANGLTGLRILLVEDMAVVAEAIQEMLGALGCQVIGPFGRVAEAKAAVGREAFSGALLDVNLDGEMVYPVADALLERNVPFAFLTGYGRQMLDPPFDGCPMIEKPFTKAELREFMVEVFARSPSER